MKKKSLSIFVIIAFEILRNFGFFTIKYENIQQYNGVYEKTFFQIGFRS